MHYDDLLGEFLSVTKSPQTYLAKKPAFVPFTVEKLPLLSRLQLIGFHKYENRWAKRFGKYLGRLLFDIAYDHLKLSGQVSISIILGNQKRHVHFDARKLHFSSIFDQQLDHLCEPELATLLEVFLTGDKVFYDIGSNWGHFSMYAAALPNYSGPIHAFEPIEETFSDLQGWVTQTGQEPRVSCHKIALSDRDGTAQMGVVSGSSGLASLARDQDIDSEKHAVQTCRLDSLKYPKPDFIKLDVEGYEFEVLQGGLNALMAKEPMIMFENWLSKDDPERTMLPIKTLLECGYILFVPMWWIGAPTNKLFWPKPHQAFPKGTRQMAYVPFDPETRLSLRDQVNFFCCHEDRLSEVGHVFDVLD
ncbi:MAG: FkbM family methyltransferase [Proteobacteria bacterium]|nr:FkbM family methyltransferase [Pseudomonadota bacterium]